MKIRPHWSTVMFSIATTVEAMNQARPLWITGVLVTLGSLIPDRNKVRS